MPEEEAATTSVKNTDEILGRLDRLEQAVFGSPALEGGAVAVKKAQGARLPDHILKLRNSGFFDSPRTSSEVHERLQSKYPCEPDRIAMALLRLHRRRELRKTSKSNGGKKQTAYVR